MVCLVFISTRNKLMEITCEVSYIAYYVMSNAKFSPKTCEKICI